MRDSSGDVLGAQHPCGIGNGSVEVFTAATINTIAGDGQWIYTGDVVLVTNGSH